MRPFNRTDQLIELYLHRFRVPILRILNEKDHEKCDNRRAGIDDELPCIAESEKRPHNGPEKDNGHCNDEGCRVTCGASCALGK